jgi:FlaA1/EpsC-like NDP-sugar epimerase
MKRSELADARRAGIRALTLRGRHFVLLDVVSTIISFLVAMGLRFDAPSPLFDSYLRAYLWAIPVLVLVRVGAFLWLRLYQRVWRYASIDELVAVLAAVVGSSVVGYVIVYAGYLVLAPASVSFPRSVPIIDTILMIALAGAWRFAFRVFGVERFGARTVAGLDRALVVGSGTAAISVIRDLRANSELGLLPVGVLADDLPREQRLLGLPVLGKTEDLATVIEKQHISAVLLALPSADGRTLRRLVRQAESAGARCLTVPGVAEVVAGRTQMDALREIDVEDLLRRAPARIDQQSVADSFRGRKILITGAGGSIGSELARQLAGFGPTQLILLGRGENSIFEAMQTLDGAAAVVSPVILDIRDSDRLHALFREIRPDVVFHAAAHKHVTFMEMYPEEAVATNVLGTQNVIHASAEVGVERFVLISSDKAVNPTSVMGVTKRVSELLVLDAARRTGKRFATVRFGNVLSSRGSVVPIFKRQLEHGGPLTVTDPEAERFFMTIPEAVQLVMQASVLAEPGDLFVLDMGDPVKIVQLANDLIELHGLKRGEDVDIAFTGLRPGEKLTEELLFPYERSEATSHEAVRRIVHGTEPPASLDSSTTELRRLVDLRQRNAILEQMREIVPEYVPAEIRR